MLDDRQVRVRTLLVVAFIGISLFAPGLAAIIHLNVVDATGSTVETVDQSSAISTVGNAVIDANSDLDQAIEQYQSSATTGTVSSQEEAAVIEAFSSLQSETTSLLTILERNQMMDQHDRVNRSLRTIDGYIRATVEDDGAYDGGTAPPDEAIQTLNQATSSVMAAMIEARTKELAGVAFDLRDLSQTILTIASGVVGVGLLLALVLSILISRPVNRLHEESEKIKEEHLDAVALDQVQTRIVEFRALKQILEDVVLTMRTELDHERSGVNDLSLALIDELASAIPRAVAESSFFSACRSVDVSPEALEPAEADDVIDQLAVSTQGLDIDAEVFDAMHEIITDETE